ncbi:hypothetical protein MATL_G00074540 [Megalops atlanticus]|uniref:Uncharacterized protein n=1 Tax=Megalops atlanticus TaxID=7932 RepID=A0A9D3Q5W4_MEGAT|nr:hypothetical protein MATL_G00074540 [Megalops atlanticus]
MTSVNSPACLLARNHFYRNQQKLACGPSSCTPWSNQTQVTIWVTSSSFTQKGVPVPMREGWYISVELGVPLSSSRPTDRARRWRP